MIRRGFVVLTVGSVILGVLTGPAHATRDYSRTIAAGRAVVTQSLKDTNATSISIALMSDGKVVWSQGFGAITPAGRKPQPDTRYGIGSISKTVTAVAVMRLVDQGKVSLDAPVVRYLPEFTMQSPQYRQITVRMLLNHSAGLPGSDYANGWTYRPFHGYAAQVLAGLRNARLKTTPGAMNVYCNDCFTLAGEVVARVSGMTYEQYVERQVFTPLGMTHSGFSGWMRKPVAPVIEDGKVTPEQYTNVAASGGVVSTPRDMLKLAQVFTGERRLLSTQAVAQMATDQTTTTLAAGPPSNFRYGLGWDDVRDPALAGVGVTAWVKGGDTGEQHGGFVVAPDQGLAVMVSGAGTTFSSGVAETIGEKILLRALVDKGAVKREPTVIKGMPATVRPTAAMIKRMTGIYLGSLGNWRIDRKGRALKVVRYADGGWTAPSPGRYVLGRDGRWWSTANPGTSLRLTRAWGRTYLVMRMLGGTGTYYSSMATAQKMRPDRTLPQWQARVGQKWLLRTEDPSSVAWELPEVEVQNIPGLPGYLMMSGIVGTVAFDAGSSSSVGSMFLQIPLMGGRDLYDFAVSDDTLQFGSTLMRAVATVPDLTEGTVIGDGAAQWFRVPRDMSVRLSGQSNWKVFDGQFTGVDQGGDGTPTVTLRAGHYLVLFGAQGSAITIG